MGSLYSEAGYKQKIAVLEEKKNLLVRQLKKKDMMCRFLEKEKEKRDSRTMFQEVSLRLKKNVWDSELTGPCGENLTWIIHIDSPDTSEMCLSFCRHHPVFNGKIIIADSLHMPEILSEIDRILSQYEPDSIKKVNAEEHREGFCTLVNFLIDQIETDWILCLGSWARVREPFAGGIRNELIYSGCHFLNLPALSCDSMKCVRQRVAVDTRWETDGEHIIIPGGKETVKKIPEFSRTFTTDSCVFRKNTFVDFGMYNSGYGALAGQELADRIFRHNYAVANFGSAVLRKPDHNYLSCSEEELKKYNTENDSIQWIKMLYPVCIFMFMVFIFASGSIIFMKLYNDAFEEKERYRVLKKIGISQKTLKKGIQKELLFIYVVPFLIMSVSSYFSVHALANMMQTDLLMTNILSVGVISIFFILCYGLSIVIYCQNAGIYEKL